MSFACSSPAGGMLFGVSGLLLLIKRGVRVLLTYGTHFEKHTGELILIHCTIYIPSLEEVGMAIEALRAHAAPGSNGIAAILLQKGGDGATALIHGAIAKVWRKG